MNRFSAVVLDADSTLSGIEGIDVLASLRGPEVARQVARLTDDAMAGAVALESVYARRLEIIAPTPREIAELGRAYIEALAPGAAESVARLRGAGVEVRVVSGGLRAALLPMTRHLGFDDAHVRAVEVAHGEGGRFLGVLDSPLTTANGKVEVVRELDLPGDVLAVGDGATDLAMRPAVAAFAAFVGFVRRPAVVAGADFVLGSFAELTTLVSGEG